MKKFFALAVFCLLPAVVLIAEGQQSPQRAHVVILSTTDMHGRIFPIDYYTNKYDNVGIAKVATLVKDARKNNPDLLLIDSGDTIQGTALAYIHNRRNNKPPDPMMLTMSALKYDAMAVGNHEYNFGLKVQEKARSEASFPWLSANTYDTRVKGDPSNYHKPYIIKEVQGVRIGILGLTTPGIPNWENTQNYPGLEFRETVSEAKKWVPLMRAEGKADVVVVAMHMGVEEDLRTGTRSPSQMTNENAALAIARQVPGVDVILMGHTHRDVPSLLVNNDVIKTYMDIQNQRTSGYFNEGVLLTQANRWGSHLARVDLYLEKGGDNRWHVLAKSSRTIPVTEKTEVDAEIARLGQPYHDETQAWLAKTIGESNKDLTAQGCRSRDTAIIDLIHKVQLEAGKGDVSMAACFNTEARISQGTVTVREIASLYEYENTLVTVELTGQQVKDVLEHSARYFKEYQAGKSLSELVDTRIPGYNFDMAEGVTYDLDLTKPSASVFRILSSKVSRCQQHRNFAWLRTIIA